MAHLRRVRNIKPPNINTKLKAQNGNKLVIIKLRIQETSMTVQQPSPKIGRVKLSF